MGTGRVEDGEERLVRVSSTSPVCFPAQFIPSCDWRIKLVVGFHVVRTVVACGAQVLCEAPYIVRHNSGVRRRQLRGEAIGMRGPHVMRANRDRVHPCNDRCTGRSANPGCGERVLPKAALRCQTVKVRCPGNRVSIAAIGRVSILKRDPQEVRLLRLAH